MRTAAVLCIAAAMTAVLHAQQRPAAAVHDLEPAIGGDTTIHVLHVQGGVYMLVGAGGNTTVQVGDDGPLVVDPKDAAQTPAVMAAIGKLSGKPIHTIVVTHLHAEHGGGSAAMVKARGDGPQPVRVMAHENVLNRLVESGQPEGALRVNPVISLPINDEYYTPTKDFFLNGEAVVLHHVPAAHTDGDTFVFFRRSDVISAGDVFTPDLYPVLDLDNGGSVNGEIAALNHLLELMVPAKYQEGGTYVVPGHGRLCDEAEVVEYRDMLTIIRDRVKDLIGKGLTLPQIEAARPTRDFDVQYGTETGFWTSRMFLQAVYRSLAR